jgi:hypothetical protein
MKGRDVVTAVGRSTVAVGHTVAVGEAMTAG